MAQHVYKHNSRHGIFSQMLAKQRTLLARVFQATFVLNSVNGKIHTDSIIKIVL